MSTCGGCNKTFNGGYFIQHLEKTTNPKCQWFADSIGFGAHHHQALDAETAQLVGSLLSGLNLPGFSTAELGQMGQVMDVDPSGDHFGDYNALDENDIDSELDGPPIEISVGPQCDLDSDESDEDDGTGCAFDDDERGDWEPYDPRAPSPELTFPDGFFDEPLQLPHSRVPPPAASTSLREPFVCRYPDPHAGAPIPSQDELIDERSKYHSTLRGVSTNPWAPFHSEIDWKIAQWAKLRGPSLTALTELLQIDGVSRLHFSTPNK